MQYVYIYQIFSLYGIHEFTVSAQYKIVQNVGRIVSDVRKLTVTLGKMCCVRVTT